MANLSTSNLIRMMCTVCGYQLVIILMRADVCVSVLCSQNTTCECTIEEPCQLILQCGDHEMCEGGHTLTCRSSYPCSLLCIGEQACANSTLIPNGATSVSVKCVGGNACGNITVDTDCPPSSSTVAPSHTPSAAPSHAPSVAPVTVLHIAHDPTPATHTDVSTESITSTPPKVEDHADAEDDERSSRHWAVVGLVVAIIFLGYYVVGYICRKECKRCKKCKECKERNGHVRDESGSSESQRGSAPSSVEPTQLRPDQDAAAHSQPIPVNKEVVVLAIDDSAVRQNCASIISSITDVAMTVEGGDENRYCQKATARVAGGDDV